MATTQTPITDTLIENWVKSCDWMVQAQDQADSLTRSWLDQGKVSRQQGQEMAHKMAEQAKENQRLFQEMVQSTVRLSLESYRIATQQSFMELNKRVEILTRQVENLSKAHN